MTSSAVPPRVEKTLFDGQSAWIKRPEASRSSRFVMVHNILERILPEILHNTGTSGGMQAIRDEAKRLKQFEAASLPVPKVLALTDDGLILSNAGDQLRGVLKRSKEVTERYALLGRAVGSLNDVHKAMLCHGRPFLKDMTIDANRKIYFLDLEEDPCARMSLQDAQARDIWLLLASCTEFCENPLEDLTDLLVLYQEGGDMGLDDNLRALGKSLKPYRRAISALRIKNLSRDITGAYWATKVMERL